MFRLHPEFLTRKTSLQVQVEADVDGVITWDFDCVLGELQFSVSHRTFSQPQCNSSLAGLVEMAGITYSTTPVSGCKFISFLAVN